ncbi:MAG: hypothetical protein WC551_00270 [Patescibacteria group bacterium]
MRISASEANKLEKMVDETERERLYRELVEMLAPHANAMLEEVCLSRCGVTKDTDPTKVERRILAVADSVATVWLIAFHVAGSTVCGSDLLPVAEQARAVFRTLSSSVYTADQLASVLSRFAETLPEPRLPDSLTRLLGPLEKWRDDVHPDEQPTVRSVVTCARDVICEKDIFQLIIHHVLSIHGKGFVASVRCITGGPCGVVHLGTTSEAYAKAMEEGSYLLAKELEEFKHR